MNDLKALEQEAIVLYRKIPKLFVSYEMKKFFTRLADALGWDQLKGVL